MQVWQILIEKGIQISLFDVWKLKPINKEILALIFPNYDYVVTLEEHIADGGFGSIICEAVSDLRLCKKILRITLPEKYIFENGNRNQLLDANGLSVENIVKKIEEFLVLPDPKNVIQERFDEEND